MLDDRSLGLCMAVCVCLYLCPLSPALPPSVCVRANACEYSFSCIEISSFKYSWLFVFAFTNGLFNQDPCMFGTRFFFSLSLSRTSIDTLKVQIKVSSVQTHNVERYKNKRNCQSDVAERKSERTCYGSRVEPRSWESYYLTLDSTRSLGGGGGAFMWAGWRS